MSSKKEILSLENMTKRNNTVGLKTDILEYKTPRGRIAKFLRGSSINLFIPTSQTVTHTGSGEETFTLDHKIQDSLSRTDEQTLKAFIKSNGDPIDPSNITIDYPNDQVLITHNTGEDLLVYYYPATGRLTLEVERPSGAGQNSRILFDNSLLKLHSVNQFQSVSPVKLSTGWDLPQKHLFKVKLDADWQVAWLSDNANIDQDYLGLVNIPFRMTKIERYSKEDLAMINRRYSM